MNSKWTRGLALVASIAIVMAVRISTAADRGDTAPPRDAAARDAGGTKFSGTVQQFNYTPRGERDGILLTSDGKLVQLNIPPQEASKLADAVAIGDQITAEGTTERTTADHTVCRLQKLTTAKGKEIAIEGPPRPRGRDGGEPREQGSRSGERESRSGDNGPRSADRGPRGERTPEKTETLKGIVKYLNRGPKGEIDGAALESGDFVQIGPREAEELKLAVGQEISVEGPTMKTPDGHTMIEHPTKINDKEVTRRPPGRGPAPYEHPAPPGLNRSAAPRGEAPAER